MLSAEFIRKNTEQVKDGIKKRGIDPNLVDEFLRLDEVWRKNRAELDELRRAQNKISDQIAQNRTDDLMAEAKHLKEKIKEAENKDSEFLGQRDEILANLPNIPFGDVPVGKDEADNKVLRIVGKKPDFDFDPKDHVELGESLGIINLDKAAEVAGARFNYLLGDAVLIEFALIRLAYDILLEEGFVPILPPVMARPEIMKKMGKGQFLQEKDAFYLPEDDLYLVGSSEHTIGPFFMNERLNSKDLPKRYVGFSTCFRREAGSYGKDTKGILRVHQFDKVEMLIFAHPDKSEEEHRLLVSMQEKIMQKLELPYQVVEICTGDMTWADARQYDIETWIPSQNAYRETNSASNTTNFQSRGINAKYEDGYLHMLNATAIAIGRTLVAIMENYQTKDGRIIIPKVLQGYVGKTEIK